jgi:NAD(P)-dependent dehydrogenase (short-subunit alcohol dehydrogenase family)
MLLKGKTALVSGAGRNNGKAIALTFAREGANVILVARELGDPLREVAEECKKFGVGALASIADMTVPQEVERVVAQGREIFGHIDVAVSVLGMRMHRPILEFSYEEWLQGFSINCHSLFLLAKSVAPLMIENKGGSIIALGGQATTNSFPKSGLVVASKHGLAGLVKNLALELGPHNIRVNLLNPGRIQNVRKNPEWYVDGAGKYSQNEIDRIPLRRVGTNQEVANAALFLASDLSSYVSGNSIFCTGGRHIA